MFVNTPSLRGSRVPIEESFLRSSCTRAESRTSLVLEPMTHVFIIWGESKNTLCTYFDIFCASCPPWDQWVSSPWLQSFHSQNGATGEQQCRIASDSVPPNIQKLPRPILRYLTLSYGRSLTYVFVWGPLRVLSYAIRRYLTRTISPVVGAMTHQGNLGRILWSVFSSEYSHVSHVGQTLFFCNRAIPQKRVPWSYIPLGCLWYSFRWLQN